MNSEVDAYRYFFPAGWLLGLWGVFLWVLFPWGLVTYPGLSHPEIMMGGFFLCFVAGFLMTAAPKFTNTFGPSTFDHLTSGVLIGLLIFAAAWYQPVFFYAVVTAVFIFLIRYMLVRFINRKSNPPDSFVFLGFGLISGLLGALGMLASHVAEIPFELRNFARALFLNAYIMCLVVGVGSRLIPALLGFAPLPTEKTIFSSPRKSLFIVLGALFIASYALEVFANERGGYLLRSLVLTYIFIVLWQIHRLPARKAAQTFGLWASGWFVLLGHWTVVFFVNYRIHILHVILVSGLALMTLMIAIRVGLSHGKHDMSLEKNSKALIVGGGLVALAGLTRLSAGFTPAIYQSHLLYAAITWMLGLIIWGIIFLPRIMRQNSPR